MSEKMWHYKECGLENIYLLNGFVKTDGKRGPVVKIRDIDGLHRAIGESLVRQRRSLMGRELRFLRHELGLSQTNLADLLGESEQSVARREKAEMQHGTPSPQERLIRFLYEEHIGGNIGLTQFLNDLAALDEDRDNEAWKLEQDGWRRADRKAA